ncbi:MAG: hypothetical protein GY941_30685 [Planctomycetes bacterium]|nr:hypothetical protein [Planctomycetota bacterium]
MKNITITVDSISAQAELNESDTSEAIWKALPFECTANTWGEEIYFEIPVTSKLDSTAREVVEKGDLGYWPTGKAFCIFFGPTPASQGDEIRPASAVNIVGKVKANTDVFKSVRDGTTIKIERME